MFYVYHQKLETPLQMMNVNEKILSNVVMILPYTNTLRNFCGNARLTQESGLLLIGWA